MRSSPFPERILVGEVEWTGSRDIERDDGETIGGFVFSHLGRVPQVGDRIEQNRTVLRVESVDDARIERLVIQRERPEQGTWTESEN